MPRPYLIPIYGLLFAVLIVTSIICFAVVSGHSVIRNREIMLYCIRQDELSALARGGPIPPVCMGEAP
jgi:hypothetical protein